MEQPVLKGKLVELHPMQAEHRQSIIDAASDGQLWEMTLTVIPSPQTIDQYLNCAFENRDNGSHIPFVIIDAASRKVVGCTRLWKIDRANRKLEIGHTWLSQSFQRSGINTEAKYLLLTYAFEVMNCVRVQFTTDENNTRSRAAILRIGAQQEGIVRHERIMPDGRKRNSVRFSIIDDEWEVVKAGLEGKMAGKFGVS
ncbi:GNAT family N-acetyltransferase [Hafnia paralvei]|uniref:GNAT family N-acetyltransferase n=1 Tax=Hafnia paralvei TaxID=546367 RepID=UPI003C2C039C